MSNIDIEIEKLEKQLAALKKAKCEEDFCNKKAIFIFQFLMMMKMMNQTILKIVFQLLMN